MKTILKTAIIQARLSIFVFLALLVAFSAPVAAQNSDAPDHVRKVVRRVVPAYPEMAKQMRLTGTVRLIAVVAPNGSVKLIQPLGGNPVFLRAAEDAISKWKYVAAPEESKEVIELRFSPE